MTTIVEFGKDKVFSTLLIGTSGLPATGKTVSIRIWRGSDGLHYTGAGWGAETWLTMTEIGTTGMYNYTLPAAQVASTETSYVVTYRETTIPAYETEEVMAKDLFTESASILLDTNELQTDWMNGGRLDLILDTIASNTATSSIAGAVWGALRASYPGPNDMGQVMNYLYTNLEANIDADIDASELAIRGGAGDTLAILSNQMDALATSISGIQNSVFFSATVKENYQRPDSGTRSIRFYAQVFDGSGSPADADAGVTITLDGSITSPPSLIAGLAMTWQSTGVYYYDYTVASTDTLQDWLFKFTYAQGGVAKTHFRGSQLSEFASDLNDIQSKVGSIYNKLPTNYIMGSTVLTAMNGEISAIHGKLPTNYLMGSSDLLAWNDEINAIFGKLPTNYIAGSGVQSNITDDILNLIASYRGTITSNTAISTTQFECTGLTQVGDYWNDLQVLMLTGGNAGQARRISDFDSALDRVIVDTAFSVAPAISDTFAIIGRYTSGASTLTTGSISAAVWNQLLSGLVTADSAAMWLKDAKTQADAIKAVADAIVIDTQDIQSRLPATLITGLMRAHTQAQDNLALTAQQKLDVNVEVDTALVDYDAATGAEFTNLSGRLPATLATGGRMRSHIEAKDATLPLSAQEKLDVNVEADVAFATYDPPTRTEATADKVEIIAEVNANEAAIGLVQVDLTTLLTRLGIPAISIYQSILDTITEVNANETLILTLTGDLATHDLAIKTLIGVPILDVIRDMNGRFNTVDANIASNYNAIIQIQNNTTTVFVVPEKLVRPDDSTKPYSFIVLNRDSIGNMEDFDALPTIQGDYVSGGVLFAPVAMSHMAVGQYSFTYDLAFNAALGAVNVKVSAVEGGLPIVLIRTTEITDFDDELAELRADTLKIIAKLDADTPSPTIPAQIDQTEIDILAALTATEGRLTVELNENQTISETMRDTPLLHITAPSLVALNNGYAIVDNGGNSLLVGAVEIPIAEGTSDFFPSSGFVYIDDGANREYLEYSGKTSTSLILSTPTTLMHEDATPIYSSVTSEIRLFVEALDKTVYHELDSAPTILILNEFGTEATGAMTWDVATRSYYYSQEYIATEFLPGKRNVIVSTPTGEGGVPAKHTFATFEVLDRPASQQSIDRVISGGAMPDTFVFDHDGWKDNANILHEWEDVMAGPLRDDTGKPATGILVRAFLKGDENQWLLVNNPPFQNYSNIFGHYRGSLEAGTYLFTFYKDNHKWKEVERIIGA